MDTRSEIEQKLEVTVGPKGVRKPMHEAFEAKGIKVHRNFVADLREGRISGAKTLRRLEFAEVTDASKKNQFNADACAIALALRTHNQDRHRAHLFKSDGYVEEIARTRQPTLETYVMELVVRAMRTDMVLTQSVTHNEALEKVFRRIAETYLKAKQDMPPSKYKRDSGPFIALDQDWDHQTMGDFYKKFYQHVPRRGIGTWVPYEMEALSLFYSQQLGVGNPLTPFDRSVLEFHKGRSDVPGVRYKDAQLAQQARDATGIEVNYQVVERHRNLLAYGSPVLPNKT